MSRPNLKTGSKSNPDSVIERAMKAAHDEFERALVAEWDSTADSPKIRNAMAVLPYRCQTCGKPIAGIGQNCVCKSKIEYVRYFSNPKEQFRTLFEQRCGGIATSASLAKFIRVVVNISLANDRNLNWVEGQLQRLLPSLKRAGRKWAIGICPLPFMHTGVLPAWVRDIKTAIPERDLQRGLNPEDTEAELVGIEAEIEQCFEKAKDAALDQASLQMAQEVRLAPKRLPRRRARQDLIAAVVARVKRDNPEASVEQICQILDAKRCPLREKDQLAGFSVWHDAWKDLDHRPRIKRFISGIPPAAPEKKI